jgi:hypothetical protein
MDQDNHENSSLEEKQEEALRNAETVSQSFTAAEAVLPIPLNFMGISMMRMISAVNYRESA